IPAVDVQLPLKGLLLTAAVINLITGMAELFPYRSSGQVNPGLPSDGLQAWRHLRGRPIPRWSPRASVDHGQRMTAFGPPPPYNRSADSSVPPPSSTPSSPH